jgi:dihydrofolate reductase
MTRHVVSYLLSSLDGIVTDPENFVHDSFDADVARTLAELIDSQDAVVLGRHTYEQWSSFWPDSDNEPFASFINGVAKYVATRTLTTAEWSHTSVTRDIAATIAALKAQPGRNIGVHGSVQLVRSMLQQGLIDQLKLAVFPATAATGLRVLDGDRDRYELVDLARTGSGVVIATYRPLR